jgi:hypothetical protein
MPIARFVREFDGWIYDRLQRGYLALGWKNLTCYPYKPDLTEQDRPPQHYEGSILYIKLAPGREMIIPPEELEDHLKMENKHE